ncbi:FxSxx-COOH system tetratricopeptide repeat protein [Actinoplanes subglobosus]|uniref:FxSxx-COOH system tetratricopeptide repeat protein n=1 Tax=Actinoplanes subglobosus TaxID=1547892 RepID=A0ABV8IYC0_9ACTN
MTGPGGGQRRPWWRLPLLEAFLFVVLGALTNVFTGLLPESWKWAHDLRLMGGAFVVAAVLTIVVTLVRQRRDRQEAAGEPVPAERAVTARTVHGPVMTGDGAAIAGPVVIGDGATVVQHAAPSELAAPAAVPVPDGLVNVVSPGVFVGRAAQLARLDAVLEQPETVVVQAVHGLGGVGKSTLAAEWAWRHRDRYRPVWWIDADTAAAIDAGLAALAAALQTTATAGLPLEVLRERAVQWLASHDGWLLVLDNVDDPRDVAAVVGRVGTGRVLVTSRRATGWAGIATPVGVDVLALDDAVELMRRVLAPAGRDHDDAGLARVCRELGCLPLAVKQAASYLAETGLSPDGYLDLLKAYPADVFAHGGEGDGERTIARVWRVTLDRLADTPTAGEILRVVAWYAADGIPRSLLDGLADPPAIARAVGRLTAYSMITTDESTLTVHRLVQAVARTPDPEDPHRRPDDIRTGRRRAATQLQAAMPDTWRQPVDWPRWRVLAPQVEALAQHSPPRDDDVTASLLYNRTALFLKDQGALGRAVPLYEQALADRRRALGDDHPQTLVSVNNLAGAYESAGDLGRAVPLYEQALADHRRVLGDDHPQTLTSVNNLAGAYESAGDLGRAVPLYEQALADRRRVLGDDHPQTLNSVNNLAYAYEAAGDLGRAVPLYEQALADRRRVLGDDHPQTLTSVNNLAGAYEAAGDLGRAVPLYEQALAGCRRVLGDDHPQTLTSVNNLAYAYRSAGDLGRAVPLYEQALAGCRRVLGDDHPDTLTSVNNLAGAYRSAGDLGRAVPLYEQALAGCRRVLGDDHPTTKIVRENLAAAIQER